MTEDLLDIFLDSLLDAIKDTLWVLPFLLVTYLIMEAIEHKLSDTAQATIKKSGAAGPILGAALGIIPQCGFSAAASAFYAGRVITLGTLFAVFLSTSDEMLPIFIAGGIPLQEMLTIIVFKFVIGMLFGFIVDFVLRATKRNHTNIHIHDLCKRSNCNCHEHNENGLKAIIKSALIHTIQITLFVFIITLVLNVLIGLLGGDEILATIISDNKIISVFISGLCGLIPNCAASVVIAQLYVDGVLSIGASMAGLLCASGVGLLVLLRTNRPSKQNLYIVLVLYGFSVLTGLILCLFV